MAKAKQVSKFNTHNLLTVLAIVILVVFAVLVGQQVIKLKHKHDGTANSGGTPSLAPAVQLKQ